MWRIFVCLCLCFLFSLFLPTARVFCFLVACFVSQVLPPRSFFPLHPSALGRFREPSPKACAANPSLRHDSTPKSQKPIAAGGPPAPRRYSRQSLPPSLTGRSSGRNPHDEAPGVRSSGLDLSALQDVGDIVQSVAGGSDMGGAGLGGNGGNGAAAALSAAAPLGLLHALKASAQAVGDHANAAAAAVATTTMTASRNTSGNNNKSNGSPPFSSSGGSGSSSSRSAFAGAHNGASRNKDHARDASRGTAPGGGGGGGGAWESIPLSQRLAGAGKSAGTAPAGQGNAVRKDDGGGGGGGALVGGNDGRNMKSHLEQQQHQQQQSQQLRRASGLGTRRVLDGGVERGAGGDGKSAAASVAVVVSQMVGWGICMHSHNIPHYQSSIWGSRSRGGNSIGLP